MGVRGGTGGCEIKAAHVKSIFRASVEVPVFVKSKADHVKSIFRASLEVGVKKQVVKKIGPCISTLQLGVKGAARETGREEQLK